MWYFFFTAVRLLFGFVFSNRILTKPAPPPHLTFNYVRDTLGDLEKIAEKISFEVTPRLKQLITRWDDEDPLGMKARYPIDLDGYPSRFKNAVAFDLKILAADYNSAIIELMHLLDEYRAQERF